MFDHKTAENLSHQVKINDVDPEVFQELLRFVYMGRIPQNEDADDWTFGGCREISSRESDDGVRKVFGQRNFGRQLHRVFHSCRWP